MISIQELKYYLKTNDADLDAAGIVMRDTLMESAIDSGKSELDALLDRTLARSDYSEKIICNSYNKKIFTKQFPIIEVSAIKYYNGTEYVDLIQSPDTIENNVENLGSYLLVRGYWTAGRDLQINYTAGYEYKVLTGTLSGTIGTADVTGINTLFTTELSVGDKIIFEGEVREVETITDNTNLVLTSNLSKTYASISVYLNTYPADIRKACLELAAMHFLNSPQGDNRLGKSSANINLGAGVGDQYKALNFQLLKSKYRRITI